MASAQGGMESSLDIDDMYVRPPHLRTREVSAAPKAQIRQAEQRLERPKHQEQGTKRPPGQREAGHKPRSIMRKANRGDSATQHGAGSTKDGMHHLYASQQNLSSINRARVRLDRNLGSERQRHSWRASLILILIMGDASLDSEADAMIARILDFVQKKLNQNPNMILRSRTGNSLRINYDPQATDITSIVSRLLDVFAANGDHDWSVVEYLLCPLVAWNRELFRELKSAQVVRIGYDSEALHDSVWRFHSRAHTSIGNFTWNKRKEIVAKVVNSVRLQCQNVDPKSLLLVNLDTFSDDDIASGLTGLTTLNPKSKHHAMEWNLSKTSAGFESKVMVCFDGLHKLSEQYEDLIESCLDSFRRANKAAVFGPVNVFKPEYMKKGSEMVASEIIEQAEQEEWLIEL